MKAISQYRIVVCVAVFCLAFGVAGVQVSPAQAPDNDTTQAPVQTEAATQQEAMPADQPVAQPASEPEATTDDQAQPSEPLVDQASDDVVEDSAQAPAERKPIPAGALQEPAGQPSDDSPVQQDMEGEPQPVDTTATQPVEEPADQPQDTTAQQPAEETPGEVDTTSAPAVDTTAETISDTTAQPPAEAAPERAVNPDSPYEYVEFAAGEKPKVILETTKGDIEIELWPDVAPRHCQSFVHLVESNFYDSLTFHRVVPGFIIQGGDPLGNGTGGPGYKLPPEFSDLAHEEGTVSAARLPSDRNSAGSQFFICLGRLQSLDGQYTIFGRVVEGLNVIHEIERVPVAAERPMTPVYILEAKMESSGQAEPPPPDEPVREQ